MYHFLIRWQVRKLAKPANHQISQTRFLLDTRGAQIDARDRTVIEARLEHADDLREGLEDRPRWVQIKQARLFRDWADETLRITEGMLPPDPQIQAGPFRRRIN